MKIKTVSFRSCVTIGKFRTVHIEASADVPQGRKPESVLNDLKVFVARELGKAKDGEEREVVKKVVERTGRFDEMFDEHWHGED